MKIKILKSLVFYFLIFSLIFCIKWWKHPIWRSRDSAEQPLTLQGVNVYFLLDPYFIWTFCVLSVVSFRWLILDGHWILFVLAIFSVKIMFYFLYWDYNKSPQLCKPWRFVIHLVYQNRKGKSVLTSEMCLVTKF